RRLPLEDGHFDGDRWHDDGTWRTRCMNSESARAALASARALTGVSLEELKRTEAEKMGRTLSEGDA
ncbi:MAG TPA: hypothetical protein VLA89_17060, partial [Gemmatimonadales bacterium]|nr:hypothetical protein [Gemmatimonadales bacterium]